MQKRGTLREAMLSYRAGSQAGANGGQLNNITMAGVAVSLRQPRRSVTTAWTENKR